MGRITMVDGSSAAWSPLEGSPGEIPSPAWEIEASTSDDGRCETGLWRREPDTWAFERPYDEVALILSGAATIETADGRTLALGPGDVLITTKGSKGAWRISDTLTKFYAIYRHDDPPADPDVRVVGTDEPLAWAVLENPPGDDAPPGEEVVISRSADRRFATGFWRRAPETGTFERTYDEIALIQEGVVDVEPTDGGTLAVRSGDVLVTPMGSSGVWRAHEAVRKFWVVYHA
ncbi:MAG TPA: cupin domain-containing protein [Actinomycetota bacterium]